MSRLPNKPSKLIRVAIGDMELVLKNKKYYRIDMSTWHSKRIINSKPVCEVCFAGGVMAMSLHADYSTMYSPHNYDNDTADKLHALNEFRLGYIKAGFILLGLQWDERLAESIEGTTIQLNSNMTKDYVEKLPFSNEMQSPKQIQLFINTMIDLSSYLEAHGY